MLTNSATKLCLNAKPYDLNHYSFILNRKQQKCTLVALSVSPLLSMLVITSCQIFKCPEASKHSQSLWNQRIPHVTQYVFLFFSGSAHLPIPIHVGNCRGGRYSAQALQRELHHSLHAWFIFIVAVMSGSWGNIRIPRGVSKCSVIK